MTDIVSWLALIFSVLSLLGGGCFCCVCTFAAVLVILILILKIKRKRSGAEYLNEN